MHAAGLSRCSSRSAGCRGRADRGLAVAPARRRSALLARSGDWTYSAGDAVLGVALVTAELVLLYGVGRALGGRAVRAARRPRLDRRAARRCCATGSPAGRRPTTSGRLPRAVPAVRVRVRGAPERSRPAACCSLSGWLALAPLPRATLRPPPRAGAAAGAAALVHPRVWPALAAPVLALRGGASASRRARRGGRGARSRWPRSRSSAHVPGIHPGWHTIGASIDQFREFSWSRRVLEYLPLAGLSGSRAARVPRPRSSAGCS